MQRLTNIYVRVLVRIYREKNNPAEEVASLRCLAWPFQLPANWSPLWSTFSMSKGGGDQTPMVESEKTRKSNNRHAGGEARRKIAQTSTVDIDNTRPSTTSPRAIRAMKERRGDSPSRDSAGEKHWRSARRRQPSMPACREAHACRMQDAGRLTGCCDPATSSSTPIPASIW